MKLGCRIRPPAQATGGGTSDPRPGEWSDARKHEVLAGVDELLALLPTLHPQRLWARLDAIERLATDRAEGILNEMARDELVVQIRALAAASGSSSVG